MQHTIDNDTFIALENSVITLQRVLKAIKDSTTEQPAPVIEQPAPVVEQPAPPQQPTAVAFSDDQVRTWMISSGVEISREWIDWISGATGVAAREALASAYPGLWEECTNRMLEQQAMNAGYAAPQQIATEPAPIVQPVAQQPVATQVAPVADPAPVATQVAPVADPAPVATQPVADPAPVATQPAADPAPVATQPAAEQPAVTTPPPAAEQPAAPGEMDDMAELENELAAIENEGAAA